MSLSCSPPCVPVSTTQYQWFNIINSTNNYLLNENSSELVLSENVTSDVAHTIFGEVYECRVECIHPEQEYCKRFKIWGIILIIIYIQSHFE